MSKKNLAQSPREQVTPHLELLSNAKPRLRDAEFCPVTQPDRGVNLEFPPVIAYF